MTLCPQKTDYIDIHSHHKSNEEGVFRIYNHFLNEQDEELSSKAISAGLHPWHIKDFDCLDSLAIILENSIYKDSVMLVGETGLDKIIPTPLEQQLDVFKQHIFQSEKFSKPLIIHCVKAYRELVEVRQRIKPKQEWIIHGFNSSPQLAQELVRMGFYLSVGESLLQRPEKSRNILKNIPLSRLFLETDENKKSIQILYAEVAQIYKIEVEELKENSHKNFVNLMQND